MPDPAPSLDWRFGGPLAGLPPALAWSLLAIAALLGTAWIVVSYRRTLVALAPSPRRMLVGLRLALWAGLLLALAGPVRIERTHAKNQTRPLAVLVDRSASMSTPDNRRQRRADDALRRWRALAPAATAAHGEPRLFAFADTPAPVSSTLQTLDLPAADLPASGTRLFASLDHLLAHAPPGGWGGIVALTDGLDTVTEDTSAALDATTRAALAAGTPLHLVSGRNRHSGGPMLTLRDLVVPPRVPPRSTFRLEVTLDSYQPAARDVTLRLRVGDTWREPETVRLEAGRRALAWGVDLAARSPGVLPLELRAGDAPDAPVARVEVRVAAPESTRILYYQGALDWGYRFLADILRRDPAFTLTPIFNLAPDTVRARVRPVAGSLASLPDTAAGYEAYDVVVLANAVAAQFSPAQQAALSAWTRSGGVVLFLSPDDTSSRGFAGSELEKMLPVVFAAPATAPAASGDFVDFREQMRRSGGSRDSDGLLSTREPPLSTFAWEPRALALLGSELAGAAPRFANYARVRRAKPGADVLARHPLERASEGDERAILLALQRYGRGQSALLASDALWRWKLNQPSQERGAEKFWQNLIAWLGRERVRGVRFERAPLRAEKGRELTVRVVGADTGLAVTAAPSGEIPNSKSQIPNAADSAPHSTPDPIINPTALFPSGENNGARLYRWTPPAQGLWVLTARGPDDAPPARHWIDVAVLPTGENSGLPPDEQLLRSLAERTGGAVLDTTPPAAWRLDADRPSALLLRETAEPLWHRAWLFALLLALYATELVLRRRHHLL